MTILTFTSYFAPKHIQGVGTFQDAGPLENDPLVSALSAVAAHFPLAGQLDFLLSLSTGEPKPQRNFPTTDTRSLWKNGAFPRLGRLVWERMRDSKTRRAFREHPRYHRLTTQFNGREPRLDDVQSIPELKSMVDNDIALTLPIKKIARCFVASLFYFELSSLPRHINGRKQGNGIILCSIKQTDPAFPILFERLAANSAEFRLNNFPTIKVVQPENFDSSGNFRMKVDVVATDSFDLTLKQDSDEPIDISGSPFSISRLVRLQCLKAVFGRPDHKKRKSGASDCCLPMKRRKMRAR